jgi:carboxyl-terminal processing protease
VIRIAFLLSLCFAVSAHAQGLVGNGAPAGNGFDVDLLLKVQAEAIDFMLPRTLDAVSAAQLAMWGLGGLTAIDPALTAFLRDTKVQLLMRGREVFALPAPSPSAAAPSAASPFAASPSAVSTGPDGDATAWARVMANVVSAGYDASPALRQTTPAVVTKTLLDEMLAHLDPYSRYIPPIEAVDDRDRRAGHAGIGVTLMQRGRSVVVREVVIGSPGAMAGIAPGDLVQSVDGLTAAGRDTAAIGARLNGPEGTELRIGWLDQDGAARAATLTRAMIPPETVFPRRSGDIEIVHISGFSQTTDRHVAQVVWDALKGAHPITGIVLDLRGNRGGLLRAAVATANTFLPPGVVVRSAGRAPETNRVWLSGGAELAKNVRMAVLVDGGTASAAEVLAAALGDRGRAVVIGSSTFGKGVVQTIDPLPDGGELFLTWSRLLAPDGWPIQSLGIMPQVCTSLGGDAVARQLAALAMGRPPMADAIAMHHAARLPMTPDRIVAIREHCPAADPREEDATIALTLLGMPASYAAALENPIAGGR